MTYSIREASKLIITKEFYYGHLPLGKGKGKSEEKIFYELMKYYKIMYKHISDDKTYNNKWMVNWEVIRNYYPFLINSFETIITNNGYYQVRITEEGIEMLRKFLYEIEY